MKKLVADKLKEKAQVFAENFSKFDRGNNFNNETFEVTHIFPLSETTAGVVCTKNTGKQAFGFFYYINSGEGYWQYFIPTDSHITGMRKVERVLHKVEQHNFPKNFVEAMDSIDEAVESIFKEEL